MGVIWLWVGYLRLGIHEGGSCRCVDMDQWGHALERGPGETKGGVDLRTILMSTSLWEMLTLSYRTF